MGKKGTKRKTRWRALPLGEEDGGSGNEEELLDEDQSTTSSVVGQATNNYRSNPALFRMGEKPYRQARRFPYDKFRHREPLIKLESKTFDEEEYTKITTPRQDVLFKKGYFGKKRESSVEEIIHNNTEVEGEETVMDQIIITNGFVDERGHYLVNGSSYEIYDPYTNTVTVVVGPPPYANGVSPPVLAAVSCQPVPLQPVDWYPPGTEWPNQGTAWTPTYQQTPHSDSVSSPGQSCESTPTSLGSEGQSHNMYHHPAYIPLPHGYVYAEPPVYNVNGVSYQDSANSTTEVMCSNGNSLDQKLMKTRRKSEESTTNDGKENATESDKPPQNNFQSTAIETTNTSTSIQNSNSSLEDNKKEQNGTQTPLNSTNEEQDVSTVIETKHVEKQSHSTQTNLLETQKLQDDSIQVRVKESHSTQTTPDETIPNNKKSINNKENEKNEANRSLSDILLSSLTKSEQEPKVPTKPVNNNFNVNNYNNKMKDYHKTSPKKSPEESPRRIYQKRTNFSDERNKLRVENVEKSDGKPTMRSIETSPIKTSYAKKVMNGLENGNAKVMNGSIQMGNVKKPAMNGSNTVMNGSNGVMNGANSVMNGANSVMNGFSQNVNKTPLMNGNKESVENRKNQNYSKNKSYERPRFNRSLSNGKNSKEANGREKKVQLDKIPDKVEKEVTNESRNHSEKSSTVSELSSPTELSSGQNTPPEKLIVKKMEQKIANEINKSFEEKLKQNLEERKEEVEEVKEIAQEDVDVAQEPTPNNNKNKKQAKKKNKAKEEVKETPKSNKSKKKKKQIDESKDEYDYSNQEIPFLPPFMQRKPDDFLFNGKAQDSDLISDIDSLLTTEDGDILKSLGISEDKLNLSKLPLSSGFLKMLPTFNRDRPKFKFDDYFASTSTKQWQSDLYTKTNITNMKSTKPEEFFASIIENPSNNNIINNNVNNDVVRTDNKNNKKDGTKNEKKEIIDTETDKIETAKETNHGAQVIVKKSINIPKTGYKINKNNLKYKVNAAEKVEVKEEKKNDVEEVKLGIVEAVNTWLQEQGDSEKVLSVNSLPQSFDKIDTDEEEDNTENQKNVMSNPLNVTSVNNNNDEDDLMRVANKKMKNIRRYRSSSLDAKLSDMKIKKFLTESANYCQDLIGDVKNGLSPNFEFAREELCDPKESVKKYYTLSPSMVPKKKIEDSDSENEVFDVLEYKFVKQEGRKLRDGNGNLSITDSGVHSDSESSSEGKGNKDGIEHQQVPNKEVCNCKLQ